MNREWRRELIVGLTADVQGDGQLRQKSATAQHLFSKLKNESGELWKYEWRPAVTACCKFFGHENSFCDEFIGWLIL